MALYTLADLHLPLILSPFTLWVKRLHFSHMYFRL